MSGKSKAILCLVVMFLLGLAAGAAWQSHGFDRPHGFRPFFTKRRFERFSSRLHLAPAQDKAVQEIFEKTRLRVAQLNDQIAKERTAIHEESVKAINEILNSDQRREFEQMHRRMHKHHPSFSDSP